ncbi:MAG TPA: sialidase family protein [Kofleriaceae bacterium]|nr:sialidase family protein [Kofleriaceae bacterium]
MRRALALAILTLAACGGDDAGGTWLGDTRVLVQGVGTDEQDCTTAICPHNENTDLLRVGDAIYLVHRTAQSQILGPNSSLLVYRSDDGGKTFTRLARILAPQPPGSADLPGADGRDLRDPSLFVVDGKLTIKAITRLPHMSTRDSDVDSISVGITSPDGGATWGPLTPLGPVGWSFWRVVEHGGRYYSAAYQDGDLQVKLFSSDDGVHWLMGPTVYDVSADTPLETELVFMPSGRLLALVRMDGTDDELLGNAGRLRTQVCWAEPPYDRFDCPQTLDGERLDGPVAFWHDGRLFVVARKHLPDFDRKRTNLFELGGNLDGGPLTITDLGSFPSAGDTAYAGYADVDADHGLVTWYSSDLGDDRAWLFAILDPSDIWQGTIDFTRLPAPP